MTIKILGTEYVVRYAEDKDCAKIEDANGFCELMTKEIVLNNFKETPTTLADVGKFENKVLRHEIIHAFLYESGLHSNSEFALNEEMVDWIAIQFPKMAKVFKEAKCLEGE